MINKIRQQHPQYDDMSDGELMDAIYQKHYADMPRDQFNQACGMPDHENLDTCAVRGQDSLELQDLDPTIKPAVKMTFSEFQGPQEGKIAVILPDGTTYVVAPEAVNPIDAISAILSGEDSELLGYPAKGNEHAAVTKQGDVVTDIPEMRQHAEAGNVAWAANGTGDDLMNRAANVARTIQQNNL